MSLPEVADYITKLPDVESLKRSIRNDNYKELIEGVNTRDIVVQAKAITSQLFSQNEEEIALFTKNDNNYLPCFRSNKFSLLKVESARSPDVFVFDCQSNIKFRNDIL